jgi:hypothetical protein
MGLLLAISFLAEEDISIRVSKFHFIGVITDCAASTLGK